MEVANRNIIQKMVIDLKYTGQVDGFALQRDLGNWCNRDLVARLEYLLDKVDTGKRVRIIDRLDLEIDLSHKGDWLQALLTQIEDSMRQKLEGEEAWEESNSFTRYESPEHHFFE